MEKLSLQSSIVTSDVCVISGLVKVQDSFPLSYVFAQPLLWEKSVSLAAKSSFVIMNVLAV